MRRIFPTMLLCCALALVCAACSEASDKKSGGGAAQPSNTTAAAGGGQGPVGQKAEDGNVVRVSARGVQVRAGGRADAEVSLDITEGYHVNANPPTDKNLIGTELKADAAEGITTGAPVYPQALLKKFAFDERPLAVYEGGAIIRLPVSADAKAAKGARTLPVKVRVQPCNDQACLPPRTVETTVPVTVE
jgi:hypothetical protein